jgi:hypothetical protein
VSDPVELGAETSTRPLRDTLSQLRLRELLMEVQDRVEQIVQGRDRLDGLVEAMLVVTSGLVPTRANGQPAFGAYLQAGSGIRHSGGLFVLTLDGDRIRAFTRFDSSVLPWFGLPRSLPER